MHRRRGDHIPGQKGDTGRVTLLGSEDWESDDLLQRGAERRVEQSRAESTSDTGRAVGRLGAESLIACCHASEEHNRQASSNPRMLSPLKMVTLACLLQRGSRDARVLPRP